MDQVIKEQFIKLLTESKAIQFGDFTLASGKKSKYYINGKKILGTQALTVICRMLAFQIYEACPIIDAVGGPEGASFLVGGVLVHWGQTLKMWGYQNDIAGFYVRKNAKQHGLKTEVEGSLKDEMVHNVCVVEDVTTTGKSALKAIEAVESLGHQVLVLATVIDRQEGAKELFEDRGIKFISLLSASDLIKKEPPAPDWDEDR